MTAIQYINLENINLVPNGDAVTIKGIYNAVESTRKRVVLTNVKFNNVERHDIEGSVRVDSNEFHITQVTDTGIRCFEISSDDTIKMITKTWAQLNA